MACEEDVEGYTRKASRHNECSIQLNTGVDLSLSAALPHCAPTKIEQPDDNDDEELVRQRLEKEGVVIVDPNISPPGSNRPSFGGGGDGEDRCEPSTSLGTTTLLHAKEKRWTARELKRRNIPSARVHQSLDSRTASAKRNRKRKTLNLPQNRVVFELAAKRLALQTPEEGSAEAAIHDDPYPPIMNRFLKQFLQACSPATSSQRPLKNNIPDEYDGSSSLINSSERGEEKEDSGVFSDSSAGHFQNSLTSPPPSSSRHADAGDRRNQHSLGANGCDELMSMHLRELITRHAQHPTGSDQSDVVSGQLETSLLQDAMQACAFLAGGGIGCGDGGIGIDNASPLLSAAVCGYPLQMPPENSPNQKLTLVPPRAPVNPQQLALNWLFSTLLQQTSFSMASSVTTTSTTGSSAVASTPNGDSISGPSTSCHVTPKEPQRTPICSSSTAPTTDANGRRSGAGKKRKLTTAGDSTRHSLPNTAGPQSQRHSSHRNNSQPVLVGRRPPSAPNKNTVKCLAQQGQAAMGDDVQLMDLEELEAFASNFKRQRIKHGFTQGDIGMALGKRYGTDFSQTTISRFEALNLSYKNMCKLRPLLKEWLEETEALLESGATVTEILEAPSAADKLGLGGTTNEMSARVQSADRETAEEGRRISGNNRHHMPQASPQLCRSLLIPHLKRRRKRTNLDNAQRAALDTFFQANPRPDHQQMIEISNELDLEADVVRVWFCNRRQKLRKVEEEEEEEP